VKGHRGIENVTRLSSGTPQVRVRTPPEATRQLQAVDSVSWHRDAFAVVHKGPENRDHVAPVEPDQEAPAQITLEDGAKLDSQRVRPGDDDP
jgi:hypothetical protein